MNTTIKLLGLISLLLVSACSSQANQSPLTFRPEPATIIQNNSNFNLPAASGFSSSEYEWDIEIDYDSAAAEAIFNFYNDAFIAQGFVRSDFEKEADEFEAKYTKGSVKIELEVEKDDNKTEVDIDITSSSASPISYTLTSFGEINIPLFEAGIKEIEWDFKTKYDSPDLEAIFAHYDSLLTNLGWQRSKLERDDDEIEANYRKDGVKLELELELDDDKVEVEIEINKLRFYQP